ncbi:MAG TPA: 3-dehydroquinate synthase [Acidimicrobiia bacterium]|nr:3-dehydroquinate synthase [Acidimicrobiia bacterium]
MRRVTIAVDPPYDALVGAGTLDDLPAVLPGRPRVAVVSQGAVATEHAPAVCSALHAAGHEVERFTIPDGEAAKTLATVETLCRSFAQWGLRRGDAVVAVGGGVVGDTAGFSAAVYHRGVPVAQVPTTLLAMVDAAIGGKTAVNLPEGKNLIGAFHQPLAVVADIATLDTLPAAEYRSGLGEVAKYALMPGGDAIADLLTEHTPAVLARDPDVLTDLVAGCVAIKAAVVAADPEERTGSRAVLNYGHTLAHALETTGTDHLAHGEAVAIGLVFAAHLARNLERVDDATIDRVHDVVTSLGLPTQVPDDRSEPELLAVMRRDKKVQTNLTFVLPGPDGLELVHDPPDTALTGAFRSVGVGG